MPKRVLTIRGVPDATLRNLRNAAKRNRRSLNAELLVVLDNAARGSANPNEATNTVRELEPTPYHAERTSTAPPPAIDQETLAAACRRFHIKSLALFGSRALGSARNDSDVDVLAEFEPGMTPGFGIVLVADALRPILGAKVDLVTRRDLSPRFLNRILPTAVPLYNAR